MVEGSGTTFEKNQLQSAVKIPQNIVRRNSKRPNASLIQPPVAMSVCTGSFAEIMR
jgi:hypothetical protein